MGDPTRDTALKASLESPSDSGFNNKLIGPTNSARRPFANLAGKVKKFKKAMNSFLNLQWRFGIGRRYAETERLICNGLIQLFRQLFELHGVFYG